jgi:hypothetical protein
MSDTETKAIIAGYQRALLSISKVAKDADNPYFNSKYIPLDSIQMAVKEALLAEGLALSQNVDYQHEGQCAVVTTILVSADGAFYQIGSTRLPVPKLTPQEAGSAFTYARRYALSALFAIVADTDDDGEGAMKPHRVTAPKAAAPTLEEAHAEAVSAVKNDFTNPLKAPSFTYQGKKHQWKDKTIESLHAIINKVGSAAGLPDAIRTRAANELADRIKGGEPA